MYFFNEINCGNSSQPTTVKCRCNERQYNEMFRIAK